MATPFDFQSVTAAPNLGVQTPRHYSDEQIAEKAKEARSGSEGVGYKSNTLLHHLLRGEFADVGSETEDISAEILEWLNQEGEKTYTLVMLVHTPNEIIRLKQPARGSLANDIRARLSSCSSKDALEQEGEKIVQELEPLIWENKLQCGLFTTNPQEARAEGGRAQEDSWSWRFFVGAERVETRKISVKDKIAAALAGQSPTPSQVNAKP